MSTSDAPAFVTPEDIVLLYRMRPGIERALVYADGLYAWADVVNAVVGGRMQFWQKDDSCVITQVVQYPQKRICSVFLACGSQKTLEQMEPAMEAWAIGQGCTEAHLFGRPGWQRSYLQRTGWRVTPHVILKKPLGVR